MSTFKNPLEDVFNMQESPIDIEKDYAMTDGQLAAPTAAPVDHKDEDDLMIEKKIDEVYDAAITAFKNQNAYLEVIEPRYAARNAEVAANYLNIALAAANSRSRAKVDRKRANATFVPYANAGGKTTNNILIADRNEILKMITIDEDKKELK